MLTHVPAGAVLGCSLVCLRLPYPSGSERGVAPVFADASSPAYGSPGYAPGLGMGTAFGSRHRVSALQPRGQGCGWRRRYECWRRCEHHRWRLRGVLQRVGEGSLGDAMARLDSPYRCFWLIWSWVGIVGDLTRATPLLILRPCHGCSGVSTGVTVLMLLVAWDRILRSRPGGRGPV